MPLQGAIVVCYGGGKVTANFRGDMVPLLGASVGCHCSVLWFGVEGDDLTQKLVFAIWGLCRSNFCETRKQARKGCRNNALEHTIGLFVAPGR